MMPSEAAEERGNGHHTGGPRMADAQKHSMPFETAGEKRHDQDTGVTEPRETDVLCGRGGAALRHPGNQTYRRLVNLNKGLYITCLKTEKLKISRSIVAAIREQNGRFLEKDTNDETWYDIGDKKAIEKTSQALRENQPKLRQKIVEMGGGVAGTAAFMESQYGHPGIYNPEQVGLTPASLDATSRGSSTGNAMPQDQVQSFHPQEMRSMQAPQNVHPSRQFQSDSHQFQSDMNPDVMISRLNINDGPTGAPSSYSQYSTQSMQPMSSFQRMVPAPSYANNIGMIGEVSNYTDRYSGRLTSPMDMPQRSTLNSHTMQQRVQRLRPTLFNRESQTGKELGFALQMDSNVSLMSEISQFGPGEYAMAVNATNEANRVPSHPGAKNTSSANETFAMDSSFRNKLADMSLPDHSNNIDSTSTHSMDISAHNPVPLSSAQEAILSTRNASGNFQSNYAGSYIDRRDVLRTMKYSRRPSEGKNQPYFQTGLADEFQMLGSSNTLMSGSSNMTGFSEEKEGIFKKGAPYAPPRPLIETSGARVEIAKVIDHSRLGDTLRSSRHGDLLAADSRHSIMSGLSRISDTSFDQSIFSDLSRKIGNVSTRSLTPSEISAMDMQERSNEDGDADGTGQHHQRDPSDSEVATDIDELRPAETETGQPLEFNL